MIPINDINGIGWLLPDKGWHLSRTPKGTFIHFDRAEVRDIEIADFVFDDLWNQFDNPLHITVTKPRP